MAEKENKKAFLKDPAFWIAIISMGISGLVAFHSIYKPAKVVGSLSYMLYLRQSSNNNGKVTDKKLLPLFWLKNEGAQSILIEDLRIVFIPKKGKEVFSYPTQRIPKEADYNSKSYNQYSSLPSGSPFQSFILGNKDAWSDTFSFNFPNDKIDLLKGEISTLVQIKKQKSKIWQTVISEKLIFGKKPFHTRKMIGKSQAIMVYSKKYNERQY